jgi:hypothetical protein
MALITTLFNYSVDQETSHLINQRLYLTDFKIKFHLTLSGKGIEWNEKKKDLRPIANRKVEISL